MHSEVYEYVRRTLEHFYGPPPVHVTAFLDVGGRNINGTCADLVRAKQHDVLDLKPSPDVTIVADARIWEPSDLYPLIFCTEMLEHVERWELVVDTIGRALLPGGLAIVTCATVPREPHSGLDGGPLRAGEWYANVEPSALEAALAGWSDDWTVTTHPRGDLYAWARN